MKINFIDGTNVASTLKLNIKLSDPSRSSLGAIVDFLISEILEE